MKRFLLKYFLTLSILLPVTLQASAEVVVIANPNVADLDANQLSRIYTGRVIQVQGVNVVPVNLTSGHDLRSNFMQKVLQQEEDKYLAYWVVRRSIGRGVPPRELDSVQELLDFVRTTPGAIGYIHQENLVADVKVLIRK